MPTPDDLAKLASKLYTGNQSIGAYQGNDGGRWDQDAATALGFPSSGFYLWSNEEYKYNDYYDGYYVYIRTFTSVTESTFGVRYDSGIQAVCLGD